MKHCKVELVAEKLRISVPTLYRMIKNKKVDPPDRLVRNNRPYWSIEYAIKIMPQVNAVRRFDKI